MLKDSCHSSGRAALWEPSVEPMVEKVLLCASLIFSQGIVENQLEVGRQCGRMGLRHYGKGEKGAMSSWVMGRVEEFSAGHRPATSNTRFTHVVDKRVDTGSA